MDAILKTGTLVGDRYRVARVAWPTAIGPVWNAHDLVLNREVLLYSLAPDLVEHSHAREAFVSCAARAAQIGGAHLAQVYDCGDDPPYLVTELPPGGRLAERLADGKLSLPETARIVVGLVEALKDVHARGTAHGAVAPAWVGLDAEGKPRLMGLGVADVAAIAAAVRDAPPEPSLVPAGYPSAVDLEATEADARGVAAVALHALTGRPPGAGQAATVRGIPQPVAASIERTLAGTGSLEDLEHAFAPFARPPIPAEREPSFMRTEGKWLFAVLAVIVLGAAAVVAGLMIGKIGPNAKPESSPKVGAADTPIRVNIVRDFDPLGDGEEHPKQTSRTTDGNQTTSWFTVSYKTIDFGHDKEGVGLVFDLGAATSIGRIDVLSPLPGWQAEWRVADVDATTPAEFRTVKSFTADSNSSVTFEATKARYWLLWITRLTDTQSGGDLPYQAAVAEVEFFSH